MTQRWQNVLLIFGFWTLIGLSFASQFYIASSQAGSAVTWKQAVTASLADWYAFAILSFPVIALARRFRLEGARWREHFFFHLTASAAFSIAYVALRTLAGQWIAGTEVAVPLANLFRTLLLKSWHYNMLIYWVIVSVNHAFDYYRKYEERAVRAAELEKRLVEARLQALQMQLNPHFLFNTLNAISTLMRRDVEAADTMITRLGQLLRYGLESTDAQEVRLEQELTILKRYLEIEQMRFGERLKVTIDVSADLLEFRVPNLMLQPLVENAIKHGIEPRAQPGTILIQARRQEDSLILRVEDNGVGLPSGRIQREGVGISNTRSRLRHLYGDSHSFEIQNRAEGGLTIEVKLPARSAA